MVDRYLFNKAVSSDVCDTDRADLFQKVSWLTTLLLASILVLTFAGPTKAEEEMPDPQVLLTPEAAATRGDLAPYDAEGWNDSARANPTLRDVIKAAVSARRDGKAPMSDSAKAMSGGSYNLADALSDALWRKKVVEKLKARSAAERAASEKDASALTN